MVVGCGSAWLWVVGCGLVWLWVVGCGSAWLGRGRGSACLGRGRGLLRSCLGFKLAPVMIFFDRRGFVFVSVFVVCGLC